MMRYESHALYFSNPWHFFSGYFDILSRLKVTDSNSTYIIWQLLVDFLKCFCYHIEYGFLHLNHLRLPFSFVLPNNRSFRWLVLSVLFIISRCQKYAVLNKFQCVTKMMSKEKKTINGQAVRPFEPIQPTSRRITMTVTFSTHVNANEKKRTKMVIKLWRFVCTLIFVHVP